MNKSYKFSGFFKNNFLKFILSVCILITFLSCNFITEKLTALKEEVFNENKKQDVNNSGDNQSGENIFNAENVVFYNKYVAASNAVYDAIERIQQSYLSMVPDVNKVQKNSFLTAAFFVSSVENLESVIKNQNRSLYDDGELSKLKTENENMKNDLETAFAELLKSAEEYYETSKKISRYYDSKIFKDDPSLIRTYDEEIRLKYKENKIVSDEFISVLESYKPVITIRNPDDFGSQDEKSTVVLLNAYGTILEAAEKFNKNFKRWNKGEDLFELKKDLENLKRVYDEEKIKVMDTDFTEKTKFMKYSFEDYYEKMLSKFIENAEKFFKVAESNNVKDWEYNNAYTSVTSYYNYFIQAYNTNVEIIQTTSKSFNLF